MAKVELVALFGFLNLIETNGNRMSKPSNHLTSAFIGTAPFFTNFTTDAFAFGLLASGNEAEQI